MLNPYFIRSGFNTVKSGTKSRATAKVLPNRFMVAYCLWADMARVKSSNTLTKGFALADLGPLIYYLSAVKVLRWFFCQF